MHILELQNKWSISKNSPLSPIRNIDDFVEKGAMSHMIDLALGASPSMVNMICDLTGWVAVSGSETNVTEATAHQGLALHEKDWETEKPEKP